MNNKIFGVGDATAEERSGSYNNNNGLASGDNSGSSPGNDDSSAFKAEVDDGGCAESAGVNTSQPLRLAQ